MFYRNLIVTSLILMFGAACSGDSFKLAESGLEYKFIQKNSNQIQPKIGDIVTLKMIYKDNLGNTIEESAIFKTPLKTPSHLGGCIDDALAMMHKGDSAVFMINAINYYTKTRGIEAPENFTLNDKLTFFIRVIDVTPYNEFVKENTTEQLSAKREEESLLKEYLTQNNIQNEPSISGLYIIEILKGTGDTPVPGKKVKVHYKGYFADGKIFDSSYNRNEPFEFNYGIGQVIQGWDEGVSKMKVGGKYKLIIPSYLAYGDKQRGPIPPNSTLIFEIELLDAEK